MREQPITVGPSDSGMLFGTIATPTAGATVRRSFKGTLAITPLTPSVTVTTGQAPPAVQFTATRRRHADEPSRGASIAASSGRSAPTGLFTPAGTLGGTANDHRRLRQPDGDDDDHREHPDDAAGRSRVDGGSARRRRGRLQGVGGDGPGAAPSMAQMTALGMTPGPDAGDPGVTIIYPYDGTVWPQGLLAPLLQWDPGAHSFDSVYVHIKEKNYEYQGYFAANKTPLREPAHPRARVDAATLSNGGEPFVISLVFAQGASVFGPYTETWTIAQATLQGTIYYNSYGTALVKNSDAQRQLRQPVRRRHAGDQASGATAPVLVAGVDSVGHGRHGLPRLPHRLGGRQVAGDAGLERQRQRLLEHGLRQPRQRHDRRGRHVARDARTSRSRRSTRTAACSCRAPAG